MASSPSSGTIRGSLLAENTNGGETRDSLRSRGSKKSPSSRSLRSDRSDPRPTVVRDSLLQALRSEQESKGSIVSSPVDDGDMRQTETTPAAAAPPLGRVRHSTFLDRLTEISTSITTDFEHRSLNKYAPRSSVSRHNAGAHSNRSTVLGQAGARMTGQAHSGGALSSADVGSASGDAASATRVLTGSMIEHIGTHLGVEETHVWGRRRDRETSKADRSQSFRAHCGLPLDQDGYFCFERGRPYLKFQLQSLLLEFDNSVEQHDKTRQARRDAASQRWYQKKQMFETAVSARERSRRLAHDTSATHQQQRRTQTTEQQTSNVPNTARQTMVPPLSLPAAQSQRQDSQSARRFVEPPLTALDYSYGDYDAGLYTHTKRVRHHGSRSTRVSPVKRAHHSEGATERHRLHLVEQTQPPLAERIKAQTELDHRPDSLDMHGAGSVSRTRGGLRSHLGLQNPPMFMLMS